MKKIISSLLAGVIALSISVVACAEPTLQTPADDDISLCYAYTNFIEACLSISNKTATCSGTIEGFSSTTTKITITVELQKKSGSSWTSIYGRGQTVSTWYNDFDYTYSGLSSGTYRVKVIGKVYSGTKYETVTAYSKEVSC